MKKLLFFTLLTGFAFNLQAQNQSVIKPFENLSTAGKSSLYDSIPKLSFKQQNDIKALFLPKPKLNTNTVLIARLDHMPIAKPAGIWNMPVVRPDGSVIYTMPVKRLPPIVKPDTATQKSNP
ncbi:MAG: hypothetical protein EOP42_06890 [Sphingobacteriaceae bacterium]|nr:MAG: hypothetical protein EOP42_06890 [Sphingobacteriaceae bacterium]